MEGRETVEPAPPEVRIDLPVDAHIPESYIEDQGLRLEAYRRLAGAVTDADVDDVVVEWVDRFGDLPPEAGSLIDLSRLRSQAIRAGLAEIVKLRDEIRLGPVDLKPSQEVRLERIRKGSVLRASEGVVFIPATEPLIPGLIEFINAMWPPESH
jgi:transcription-repair coupling factor (superfamily II helicase)